MHEHLKIEQIAQTSRQQRRQQGLVLLILLVICMLVVSGTMFLLQTSLYTPAGRVFVFADETWKILPELPGEPVDIQTSPGGTVWVSMMLGGGLSRYDGTAWRHYNGSDFGTQENYLEGGFTLVGEQLWGATRRDIIHFDGTNWTSSALPPPLTGHKPNAIAATARDVWVMDDVGSLAHFDGSAWDRTSLRDALPAIQWGSFVHPQLSTSSDGGLWLNLDGLWRFDGSAWQAIALPGQDVDATVVGLDEERLWLRASDAILWLQLDQTAGGRITPTEMSLPAAARFADAALHNGQLSVIVKHNNQTQVMLFDGLTWRTLPPPSRNYPAASHIALGSNGTVWAVSQPPGHISLLVILLPLLGLLVMSLVGLILPLLLIRRARQHERQTCGRDGTRVVPKVG